MDWIVMLVLAASPGPQACACLCVEGVPRTVCPTTEAAADLVPRCPATVVCAPVAGPEGEPEWLAPPTDTAFDCRWWRIAAPASPDYHLRKICHTKPPEL